MNPLICNRCGGPLPRPGPASSMLTCAFCGTSSALDGRGQPSIAAGAQASAVVIRSQYEAEFRAFEAELAHRHTPKGLDKAAFVAAASATLGPLCNPSPLANVVFGLAAEFQGTHGVDLTREINALPRLAISYLGALGDLRSRGQYELRIPMIATTSKGPVDFTTTLTIDRLRTLAHTEPTPPKRGLFGRLFRG